MSIPRSVAEILNHHITFELECIDRMYLNVYVPALQCEGGVVGFFRRHRGQPFASSALMDPMAKSFGAASITTDTLWRRRESFEWINELIMSGRFKPNAKPKQHAVLCGENSVIEKRRDHYHLE